MKKFNVVLLMVLTMVTAGFMGCATFTAAPLTDTGWLQYPVDAPVATIKLSADFTVYSIEKFDVPTHEKDKQYWSPITVPANTELAIYGYYSVDDGGYPISTTYHGKTTFKCPPLVEGKTYTLRAEWRGNLSAIGNMEKGHCFVLYDDETAQWIIQQMIDDGVQVFNNGSKGLNKAARWHAK
jgi:hypothetical protein